MPVTSSSQSSTQASTQGTLNPSTRVLWQHSNYGFNGTAQESAQRLLQLIGTERKTPWTLVFLVPAPADYKAGMNTPSSIADFAKILADNNQFPEIAIEPDVAKGSDWRGGNLSQIFQSMVDVVKETNQALVAANLQPVKSIVNEAGILGRSLMDYNTMQMILKEPKNNLESTELWDSGDWRQSAFKTANSQHLADPISGVYSEIYSFESTNKNYFNKPTHPLQAMALGTGIFQSIQTEYSPTLFDFPERNAQIFDWSGEQDGDPSGKKPSSSQPVFGGLGQFGPPVHQGWDLETFNTFLESYEQAFNANINPGATDSGVTMGIWAIENALPYLAPLS